MHFALTLAGDLIKKELTLPKELPGQWSLVGGTGTTFVNLLLKLPYDKLCPEETEISRDVVEEWLERLSVLNIEERAMLPGIPPTRLHILPTGLAILKSLMDYMDIERILVTRRNNLDGYLYRLYHCPEEDHDA